MRFLILLLFCLGPLPARACDLALVLAVDVSGSVDPQEYRIQMDGLAAGLRDPLVSEALVRAQAQVALLQWSGSSRQQVTLPWAQMSNFVAVDEFAHRVQTDPRVWRNFSTAVGEALELALSSFQHVPDCKRHVIDISGDGPSNEGVAPEQMRQALRADNVTVNAIAIEESEPDLTAYFFEHVITGEGAFVVTATGFQDYPDKIRRKLLREVTKQAVRVNESPNALVRPAGYDMK